MYVYDVVNFMLGTFIGVHGVTIYVYTFFVTVTRPIIGVHEIKGQTHPKYTRSCNYFFGP